MSTSWHRRVAELLALVDLAVRRHAEGGSTPRRRAGGRFRALQRDEALVEDVPGELGSGRARPGRGSRPSARRRQSRRFASTCPERTWPPFSSPCRAERSMCASAAVGQRPERRDPECLVVGVEAGEWPLEPGDRLADAVDGDARAEPGIDAQSLRQLDGVREGVVSAHDPSRTRGRLPGRCR